MDNNYIYIVLPESITQILLTIFLVICICTYIYSWKIERRKAKVIEQLEDFFKKFKESLGDVERDD